MFLLYKNYLDMLIDTSWVSPFFISLNLHPNSSKVEHQISNPEVAGTILGRGKISPWQIEGWDCKKGLIVNKARSTFFLFFFHPSKCSHTLSLMAICLSPLFQKTCRISSWSFMWKLVKEEDQRYDQNNVKICLKPQNKKNLLHIYNTKW